MLETLDLTPTLAREDFRARRPNYDRELFDLLRRSRAGGIPIVLVFEGTEVAGKGRAIFTLTEKLDPRVVNVHPIGAARKFERERPWLWRFWMKLPAHGEMGVFDESWYRRVLVERFEKKTKRREVTAAFEEIAALERNLVDDGTLVLKFFLHIDRKTQRKRMRAIESRGRDLDRAWCEQQRSWKRWERIVEDMLERTSTDAAPWTLVPATCSRYARAKVFETVIRELRRALDDRGVPALAPPIAAAPPTAASPPGASAPASVATPTDTKTSNNAGRS